ncbi:GNAT family N-acetyltransferase [Hymenobacter sp. H14-R3]|uniref:GNAT family N-acetyltransferase n=1 Tax=Hymenobacter sp. H14-R3 TaxID=3046308 RepID=UPI0024B9D017|nr:GNAT family N-acetyltransferase [Hymenobacter sp. H14-R3]MDJ0363682.1 GNAT family N-acetyltransferase [Hymenobacter sp. H14-R3]
MVLETPRLLLRPYEPADAAAFFTVLDQSRERLKTSFPDRLRAVPNQAAAPAQLAAFTDDWQAGRFYVLGIWLRETLDYLGDICLMPQRHGQAEIGYYLAAEAEGQGYAREALAAVCRFGFGRQVEAQRLLIRCYADNARAQAVARALGFALQTPVQPEAPAWFRFSFWDSKPPSPAILHFVRHWSAGD